MTKYLLIFAGGLEGTVALTALKHHYKYVTALTTDYGQKTKVDAARRVTTSLKIDHIVLDLCSLGFSIPDSEHKTVPNRPMIELAIAAGQAQARNLDVISLALNKDSVDYSAKCFYVDKFKESIPNTMQVHTPWRNSWIHQLVYMGEEIGTPFEFSYDCLTGDFIHCGVCSGCRKRQAAFIAADILDPTKYASKKSLD